MYSFGIYYVDNIDNFSNRVDVDDNVEELTTWTTFLFKLGAIPISWVREWMKIYVCMYVYMYIDTHTQILIYILYCVSHLSICYTKQWVIYSLYCKDTDSNIFMLRKMVHFIFFVIKSFVYWYQIKLVIKKMFPEKQT